MPKRTKLFDIESLIADPSVTITAKPGPGNKITGTIRVPKDSPAGRNISASLSGDTIDESTPIPKEKTPYYPGPAAVTAGFLLRNGTYGKMGRPSHMIPGNEKVGLTHGSNVGKSVPFADIMAMMKARHAAKLRGDASPRENVEWEALQLSQYLVSGLSMTTSLDGTDYSAPWVQLVQRTIQQAYEAGMRQAQARDDLIHETMGEVNELRHQRQVQAMVKAIMDTLQINTLKVSTRSIETVWAGKEDLLMHTEDEGKEIVYRVVDMHGEPKLPEAPRTSPPVEAYKCPTPEGYVYPDEPDSFDGHDYEGFPGGCARMGCTPAEDFTNELSDELKQTVSGWGQEPDPNSPATWPKVGDLVRYAEGVTALALCGEPHAGGWHGTQCMGGGIYFSSPTKPDDKDRTTWARSAVRWRRVSIEQALQEAGLPASTDPDGHSFYVTGNTDAPDQIRDGNGQVVLQQCRLCGKAEVELIPSVPCTGKNESE